MDYWCLQINCWFSMSHKISILPETNIAPKMDGWNTIVSFWRIFRGRLALRFTNLRNLTWETPSLAREIKGNWLDAWKIQSPRSAGMLSPTPGASSSRSPFKKPPLRCINGVDFFKGPPSCPSQSGVKRQHQLFLMFSLRKPGETL